MSSKWLYIFAILVLTFAIYDFHKLREQIKESSVYFLSADSDTGTNVSSVETEQIYSRLLSIRASLIGVSEDDYQFKNLYDETLAHFNSGNHKEGCELLLKLIDLDSSLKNVLPKEIKEEFAGFLEKMPMTNDSRDNARLLKIADLYEQSENVKKAIEYYEKIKGKFNSPKLNRTVEEKIIKLTELSGGK